MTSEKQLIANRDNAQKSTGPKDTTLTKLNALRHGILSKEACIDGEDENTLRELGSALRKELNPQGAIETILVERIISSVWRLRRAIKFESQLIQAEYKERAGRLKNPLSLQDFSSNEKIEEDAIWNNVVYGTMGNNTCWMNLSRYETTLERQIYRALHELERIQGVRKGKNVTTPVAIDVDISQD